MGDIHPTPPSYTSYHIIYIMKHLSLSLLRSISFLLFFSFLFFLPFFLNIFFFLSLFFRRVIYAYLYILSQEAFIFLKLFLSLCLPLSVCLFLTLFLSYLWCLRVAPSTYNGGVTLFPEETLPPARFRAYTMLLNIGW